MTDLTNFIPVCVPSLGERERQLLCQCIDSGWVSSDGPFVSQFEHEFSHFVGADHGVAVCNGTAALETAFFAIGIAPGDEVIMPSFTIISCAIAVVRLGGVPKFVDIEPETWSIDTELVEAAITNRTKAILAVHMYGHPCDMDPLVDLAKKYNLYCIEDASQVHGAQYKGRKCGSIGDLATFSFYANKIISTGEGGMVVGSDNSLIERAKSYRNLCFDQERKFIHAELGNNLRMTNMQAALGIAQLERINQFIEVKRLNGSRYRDVLGDLESIKLQTEKPWAYMVYWMYCVELCGEANMSMNELRAALLKDGIGTRPFFKGLHSQSCLGDFGSADESKYPNTVLASKNGFYLPSSVELTESQIHYVGEKIRELIF